MTESDKTIQRRLDKFNRWIKNPYNLALVGILVLALVIRLYHFIITLDQTLWWDEAEYLAASKFFAYDIPYGINPQRPPTFQFIASFFLQAGLGEAAIKFVLVLIPSIFLVFVVYLVGKEMFGKEIGLIGAFITGVSWTLLFWTARMQPDYISMSFQMLAIFFMWRYWKNAKTLPIILAGVFAGLSFHFKVSGLLVPLSFAFFILIKDRFAAFKNKQYYIFALAFLVALSPLFLWNIAQYGNPLATSTNYSPILENDAPFQIMQNLTFYYTLTQNVFFILFILGTLLGLKFLLYADVLIKDKKKCFNPNLFSILVLVVVSLFYMFWIKETQDRWVFLWIPFIGFLAGNALLFIHSHIKKYHRLLSIVLVVGLLIFVGYLQVAHADSLIKNRVSSYSPVKDAGIWLKDNSNPEDVVFSRSHPQMSYYSERKIINFFSVTMATDSPEEFTEQIEEFRPRFLMVSVFERHPPWMDQWLAENQERLTPVQAYFSDHTQQQAVLIIYEVGYQ